MKHVNKFNDFKLNELIGFGGEPNTIYDFPSEIKKIEKEINNLLDAGIDKSIVKKKILKIIKQYEN
jgi:hypothetical protein